MKYEAGGGGASFSFKNIILFDLEFRGKDKLKCIGSITKTLLPG